LELLSTLRSHEARRGREGPGALQIARHLERVRSGDRRRRNMKRTVTRLVRQEVAQDLIEYGLLAGLLAVACITALLQLSGIREFFATAGQALAAAL